MRIAPLACLLLAGCGLFEPEPEPADAPPRPAVDSETDRLGDPRHPVDEEETLYWLDDEIRRRR